jgi:hypothetical protein
MKMEALLWPTIRATFESRAKKNGRGDSWVPLWPPSRMKKTVKKRGSTAFYIRSIIIGR